MGGLSFAFQRGNFLLFALAVLLAAGAVYWAYRRTLPPIPPRVRLGLAAIRFSAYFVLLLILFDPLLTFESVLTIKPNVTVLVDRSSSMGIADRTPGAGGEEVRRIDEAESLLRGPKGDLAKALERRYDVKELGFAGGLTEKPGAEGGDATDIAGALEAAVEAQWERGVDAFVLLSDGIVTAGRDPVRAAAELGIPVFPVPIGDATPPRDIALDQVLANPLVYVKSRVNVEVTVRAKGFAGETVPVRILEGDRVVAEDSVRFDSRREVRPVSLGFPVYEEGTRRYTVEVPVQSGELVEENNRILFTVEVVKEKLAILVFAERPGFDFSFLRRSLERDPNVDARFFVQGKDGSPLDVGPPGHGPFPFGRNDLYRYDLVVLFGLPAAVTRDFGDELADYVRSRGGALLVIAADPLPGPYPKALAGLLPVRAADRRPDFDAGSFSVRLTERGLRSPLLRLHRDPAASEALWAELPPLTGALRIGPATPGSVTLAVHPTLQSEGEETPVLVLGTAGKGRVLFWNGAGTWRWDFRMWGVGKTNETYERFWSNVVRYLVSREGFRNVTIKPENMTYNRGEPVVFRGLVMDGSLAPVADARVEVAVRRRDGGGEERFYLEPDPAEAGAYRRTVGPYAPGDYEYRASVVRGDAPIGDDKGEFSVSDFSPEFLETERNDELLRSLARTTGGEVIPADEIPGWNGDLSLESRTRRILDEREIWNSVVLFLLAVFLFSAEWWLRKRRGLT